VVFRPIDLYVITSTFFLRFLRFFHNPKKRDYTFFAVFHTFSRTMLHTLHAGIVIILGDDLKCISLETDGFGRNVGNGYGDWRVYLLVLF